MGSKILMLSIHPNIQNTPGGGRAVYNSTAQSPARPPSPASQDLFTLLLHPSTPSPRTSSQKPDKPAPCARPLPHSSEWPQPAPPPAAWPPSRATREKQNKTKCSGRGPGGRGETNGTYGRTLQPMGMVCSGLPTVSEVLDCI